MIPFLIFRPSTDLGSLARDISILFPGAMRHLLRGIGAGKQNSSADLISYLAFDGRYTTRLLELGKKDALAQKDALHRFFHT